MTSSSQTDATRAMPAAVEERIFGPYRTDKKDHARSVGEERVAHNTCPFAESQ